MNLGQVLQKAGPEWIVLGTAGLFLVTVPVLRVLLPATRRRRGGAALLLLGGSALLAGTAVVARGMAGSPGSLIQLGSVLLLVMGLVAVAFLIVFDLVLARVGLDVPAVFRDLLQLAISAVLAMGFLRLAGLDLFSLVTTSAVLTAVIGLALQSTIANVFGGLALQLDRTLGRGEWIEVGSRVGRILEIGWRSTRMLTKDGDTVFVPNSALVSGEVLNFSRPTGAHRMTVRIGFHYRHPPDDVNRALVAALADVPGVLADPAPDCGPTDFGESAIVYALRYWIAEFEDDHAIDGEVRTRLWYAAQQAGLEIPFPIRTLLPGGAAHRLLGTVEAEAPGDGSAPARRNDPGRDGV